MAGNDPESACVVGVVIREVRGLLELGGTPAPAEVLYRVLDELVASTGAGFTEVGVRLRWRSTEGGYH